MTQTARHAGTGYSRITLVGATRRADLVLPSDEPVGALFGEMLDVLGEQHGTARLVLMTGTGRLVPTATSLTEAGVVDGAVLRLVAEHSAPPPPVVNDVTEETATDIGARGGRWSQRASDVFAICGSGVFAVAVTVQVYLTVNDRTAASTALLAAGGLAWLIAIAAAFTGRAAPVVASAVVGAVLGAGGILVLASVHEWTLHDRAAGILAVAWVATAIATAGRRRAGELTGAALGAVLSLGWLALARLTEHSAQADAVVVLVAVAACGLLPQWALSASGLAALDDRRMAGSPVRRDRLRRSLRDAHLALIASTAAVSIAFTVCGTALAQTGKPWPVALAACAAAAFALRSRSLPLAAEGALMLAAPAVVAGVLGVTWIRRTATPGWALAATVALGLAVYSCVWLRPPAHTRARLRGLGDRLEAAVVIAVVPLTVGAFGIFGSLLHTFD